jgi:molybdopterin synthase catalytic subunit
MRVALVDSPIDVAALISEVSDDSCGAATVFLGCVRNVNEGTSGNRHRVLRIPKHGRAGNVSDRA